MPHPDPPGAPLPADGTFAVDATLAADVTRAFGVYVHVPYCRVRCGYCDFNTYTSDAFPGASRAEYPSLAAAEIEFGARALERSGVATRPVSTVFFGGGTPTQLAPNALGRILATIDTEWGLAQGYEATVEANPDSVDRDALLALAEAGFTRVSFGMQSAVPAVLATLDRTHHPERVPRVMRWAREAGLRTSLDLIYGTPGESMADWQVSVEAALACDPDHLSAYALILEPGTRLEREVRAGRLSEPDDDLEVDKYEWLDARLAAGGFDWYELSNWARADRLDSACRHNIAYWTGQDWWGVGPGAHSHVAGFRWWNVRHPTAYAQRVSRGVSPAHAGERLDERARYEEMVMLRSRLRDGIAVADVRETGRAQLPLLEADGLIDATALERGAAVLTLRGRMLADRVVADLLLA